MEKFSKWRDFKTGQHPFIMKQELKAKDIALGILFMPHKMILLMISLPLLGLLQMLSIPVLRIVEKMLLRIVLFCFGIYTVPVVDKGTEKKVIVSNHQSFLDIIIHRLLYNATFVYPLEEQNESGKVVVLSFFKAIGRSIFNTPLDEKAAISLENVKADCIVYFVEGTTANGLIVLSPRLKALEGEKEVTLCAVKYQGAWNPYFNIASSFVKYIIGMFAQLKCDVQVTYTKATELNDEVMANFYRNTLRVATTPFTLVDKVEFVKLATKK